jgi:predicted DCC family thiol-disulfide oxidoreductase YuxK
MGSPGQVAANSDVILFDGLCNLCSGSVQFIIKRDPNARFSFASLQSDYGQERLLHFGLDPNSLHSIILIQNSTARERSDAALEIARNLSGLWPLFYSFKILPRFFRDCIYNWISKNRYSFFGKKDECWLPTPDIKSSFIE